MKGSWEVGGSQSCEPSRVIWLLDLPNDVEYVVTNPAHRGWWQGVDLHAITAAPVNDNPVEKVLLFWRQGRCLGAAVERNVLKQDASDVAGLDLGECGQSWRRQGPSIYIMEVDVV